MLVPFAFVAVKVKTVVEVGFTIVDPMRVDVEKLLSGEMATELAFEIFQLKVEVPALATIEGEAEKEFTTGDEASVDFNSTATASHVGDPDTATESITDDGMVELLSTAAVKIDACCPFDPVLRSVPETAAPKLA